MYNKKYGIKINMNIIFYRVFVSLYIFKNNLKTCYHNRV
jgi:hypothetical protein